MSEILLLTSDVQPPPNDNAERFARGFRGAGWKVCCACHDQLAIRGNRLVVATRTPDSFDLIWPVGFGRQATFFDRMQLLKTLPRSRFVTEVDAFMYLHGKHRWLDLMPETHTSTDRDYLLEVVAAGGDWVLKPTAGSYGRDVYRIHDEEQARRLLQRPLPAEEQGYWLLQRFIPEIAAGEKRTLIAGGVPIGTYLRLPSDGLRANVAADARIEPATLSSSQQHLVSRLAAELTGLGVGFAAIDLVGDYLMEVNIANPGGLSSLQTVYGEDFTAAVVKAILCWRGKP
ncbi:MAG: hypothetical protein R3E82_00600 [Pseudomonadales bacterium]|nr:hypothetical protein [Pseudomonadales bacterium]